MMSGIFPLHLVLLLWPPQGNGPVAPDITPQLPSGAGPVFRARMMDRSVPSPVIVAPPVERARRPAVRALPRLSSRFGWRSDPFSGVAAIHTGIDMPGPVGTPVLASAPGVIHFTGKAGGYGDMVEIDHGGGLTTRYGHLSRILVRTGQRVAPGQTIALMGSTGRSTGSHLHFEVRLNGRAVDPLRYLGTTAPTEQVSPATYWITPQQPYLSAFAQARAAAANPQETTR